MVHDGMSVPAALQVLWPKLNPKLHPSLLPVPDDSTGSRHQSRMHHDNKALLVLLLQCHNSVAIADLCSREQRRQRIQGDADVLCPPVLLARVELVAEVDKRLHICCSVELLYLHGSIGDGLMMNSTSASEPIQGGKSKRIAIKLPAAHEPAIGTTGAGVVGARIPPPTWRSSSRCFQKSGMMITCGRHQAAINACCHIHWLQSETTAAAAAAAGTERGVKASSAPGPPLLPA